MKTGRNGEWLGVSKAMIHVESAKMLLALAANLALLLAESWCLSLQVRLAEWRTGREGVSWREIYRGHFHDPRPQAHARMLAKCICYGCMHIFFLRDPFSNSSRTNEIQNQLLSYDKIESFRSGLFIDVQWSNVTKVSISPVLKIVAKMQETYLLAPARLRNSALCCMFLSLASTGF